MPTSEMLNEITQASQCDCSMMLVPPNKSLRGSFFKTGHCLRQVLIVHAKTTAVCPGLLIVSQKKVSSPVCTKKRKSLWPMLSC